MNRDDRVTPLDELARQVERGVILDDGEIPRETDTPSAVPDDDDTEEAQKLAWAMDPLGADPDQYARYTDRVEDGRRLCRITRDVEVVIDEFPGRTRGERIARMDAGAWTRVRDLVAQAVQWVGPREIEYGLAAMPPVAQEGLERLEFTSGRRIVS